MKNVFTLRTMKDGESVMAALPGAKRAVVIGAGPIGVEVAGALKERGLEVAVVEMMPNVLPAMLDSDMAEVVSERLKQSGIRVVCSKAVKAIEGDGRVESVSLENEKIPADIVVMAIGVKPDLELAVSADLVLGPTRTIAVDDRLRTSDPDIYAIGDCAESHCFITNQPVKSQLATTAIRMGKIAGVNAAGGDKKFDGVLNTAVSMACGLEAASAGLTAAAAKAAGIEAAAVRAKTTSKPHFFPGSEPIYAKIVVRKSDRKIIGGQAIGDGAAERANLFSLAIKQGVTVDDLARMEYAYAPPVSDCIEPIVLAADILLKRM